AGWFAYDVSSTTPTSVQERPTMIVRDECTLDLLECIEVLSVIAMEDREKTWEVANLVSMHLHNLSEKQLRIIYSACGFDLGDYTVLQAARVAVSFLAMQGLLVVTDPAGEESILDLNNVSARDIVDGHEMDEACHQLYFDGR